MLRLLPLLVLLAVPVRAQDAAPTRVGPVSLYADARAYRVGDLLTVILAERTAARRSSASSADASSQVTGAGSSSLGGFFGLDAQVAGRRDADSRTVQSDLLQGTITATIVGIDPAGNLEVEGQRRLNVDGDVHLMTVRGTVRPADVSTSNAVLSFQIAGADVVYEQEGRGPSFLRGRMLTLLGTAAVLVGAVLLGSTVASGASPSE